MIETEYALLDCKDDFQRQIVSNLDLAKYMANRYRWTGAENDDLIGWAMLGLTVAARHYKDNAGVKFSSYAGVVIGRTIIRGLYGNPDHPKNKVKPNYILSLEEENAEGSTLKEVIPDTRDSFEKQLFDRMELEYLMQGLDDKQIDILVRRCAYEQKLKDIGADYGVCGENIRQIKKRALKRIREKEFWAV